MRRARLLKGWKLYLALILFSYPFLFAVMWTEAHWHLREPHLSLAVIAMMAAALTVVLVVWACAGSSKKGHSN
jgi:hypothetical protein